MFSFQGQSSIVMMLCWRITNQTTSWIPRTLGTDLRRFSCITYNHVRYTRTEQGRHPPPSPIIHKHTAPTSYAHPAWERTYSSKAPETDRKGEESHRKQSTISEPITNDPVRLLYRYRYIKTARTLSNLKIYQTLVSLMSIPWVYTGYTNDLVPFPVLVISLGFATLAPVMLYILSKLVMRIICILKYNEETGEVHISHLTFWGRRRDVTLDVLNIVPISDTSENITGTYITVNTYDRKETFILFFKACTAEEKKEILRVIG